MKLKLRLAVARSKFSKIIENPKVKPGVDDCLPYTSRTAVKEDYHKKKQTTCWHTLLWSSTIATL